MHVMPSNAMPRPGSPGPGSSAGSETGSAEDLAWKQAMERVQARDWFHGAIEHRREARASAPGHHRQESASSDASHALPMDPRFVEPAAGVSSPAQMTEPVAATGSVSPGQSLRSEVRMPVLPVAHPDGVPGRSEVSVNVGLPAGVPGMAMPQGYRGGETFAAALEATHWLPVSLLNERSKVRLHVQHHDGEAEVWIGVDLTQGADQTDWSEVLPQLHRLAQEHGLRLSALVLNGVSMWQAPASSVSQHWIKEL